MRDRPNPALFVGVDLVDIDTVQRMFTRHRDRFLELVYTPAEREYCRGRVVRLACVFAAKEAAAKALGLGLSYMASGGVGLHEIEIIGDETDRPRIQLSGSAQSRAAALDIAEWSVGVAHAQTSAVAFVVALRAAVAEAQVGEQS